jgi:hypothetical protein
MNVEIIGRVFAGVGAIGMYIGTMTGNILIHFVNVVYYY